MPVAQAAKPARGGALHTCDTQACGTSACDAHTWDALLAPGLPLTKTSTQSRASWYVLRMPQHRKEALCTTLKQLLSKDVLLDAFVLRKERWIKRQRHWFLQPVDMYQSYAFAISSDGAKLSKALAQLTLPIELVGDTSPSPAPLSDEVAAWYAKTADAHHVIRASTAEITSGVLHVYAGPLIGQEPHISKIDRHRRLCTVRIGKSAVSEQLALEVPHKE